MKSIFLGFMCFISQYAFAANGQETFLQANKAYEEKNYEAALTLYSKIEKKGAATWYNIGNCHFQLGHEADAIASWQRARKGGTLALQKDCNFNIDIVLHGSAYQGSHGFSHTIIDFWNSLSLLQWQLIFLLIWILFWSALYLSKRSKKYKVATFVLALCLLPVSGYLGSCFIRADQMAAVVHTQAKLYTGPNEKYHVVAEVAPKDQLVIHAKLDNWYKVTHNTKQGWVQGEVVAVI